MFYHILQSPQKEELVGVYSHAVNCLYEIINKRMPTEKKLSIIAEVQIVELLVEVSKIKLLDENARSIASLINLVTSTLFESYEEIGSSTIVLPLLRAFEASYPLLSHSSHTVVSEVTPLIQTHLSVLLMDHGMPIDVTGTVRQYINIFILQMQFPIWFDHDDMGDDEIEFLAFRESMDNAFRSLLHKFTSQTLLVLEEYFSSILSSVQSISPNQLEVSLHILHLIALGPVTAHFAKDPQSKPAVIFSAFLIAGFDNSISDSFVVIQYHELLLRFSRVLQIRPELFNRTFSALMGNFGILHPVRSVRSRSVTILVRLIKSIDTEKRSLLQPHIPSALENLRVIINICLTSFAANGFKVSQKTEAAQNASPFSDEDLSTIAELMGILMTPAAAGDEVNSSIFVEQSLQSMLSQLHIFLNDHDTYRESPHIIQTCARIVRLIGDLGKPFSSAGPAISNKFLTALQSVLGLIFGKTEYWSNGLLVSEVRSAIIYLLHLMVDCLQLSLLKFLPTIVSHLIETSSDENFCETIQLFSKFVAFYDDKIFQMLDDIWSDLMGSYTYHLKNHMLSNSVNDKPVAAHSSIVQQNIEFRRVWFSFLSTLSKKNCLKILISSQNIKILSDALALFYDCMTFERDLSLIKMCFFLLKTILTIDVQSDTFNAVKNQFENSSLFFDQLLRFSCTLLFISPDMNDAVFNSLVLEICKFHVTLYQTWGGEFLTMLAKMLELCSLPNDITMSYISILQSNSPEALRRYLRECVVVPDRSATPKI